MYKCVYLIIHVNSIPSYQLFYGVCHVTYRRVMPREYDSMVCVMSPIGESCPEKSPGPRPDPHGTLQWRQCSADLAPSTKYCHNLLQVSNQSRSHRFNNQNVLLNCFLWRQILCCCHAITFEQASSAFKRLTQWQGSNRNKKKYLFKVAYEA